MYQIYATICYFSSTWFVICEMVKYADHRDFNRSRSRARSLWSKELRSLTDHEKVNAVHERRSPVHVHFDIAKHIRK